MKAANLRTPKGRADARKRQAQRDFKAAKKAFRERTETTAKLLVGHAKKLMAQGMSEDEACKQAVRDLYPDQAEELLADWVSPAPA